MFTQNFIKLSATVPEISC